MHWREIEAYYDETWWDYRVLWLNPRNHALHFGYHDDGTRGHADALLCSNRSLAARARIRPGDRVLDAGCGVGGSSTWLAAEHNADVIGIALGRNQMAMARRIARRRGLDQHVRFLCADFAQTPFPAASFQIVWALESLCHAQSKLAFYREAARLLRPGGRVVVADFVRADRPLGAEGEVLLREWLQGWAIPDLDTAAEHERHLLQAGFSDIAVEDFTERVRPSLQRLYRIAHRTFALARLARLLRMRSAVQHGNVIGAVRQYEALQRGLWRYVVVSASRGAT